jgi:hypothetical protein
MDEQRKTEIAVINELTDEIKLFHKQHPVFVMDIANYRRVRKALTGAMEEDPNWQPTLGDMFVGYLLIVEESNEEKQQKPHLEMRDIPLRPPVFAGVTQVGRTGMAEVVKEDMGITWDNPFENLVPDEIPDGPDESVPGIDEGETENGNFQQG